MQLGQLLDLDLCLVSPTSNSTIFQPGPYTNLMDFEVGGNYDDLQSEDSHPSTPCTPFEQSILALSTDLFELTYRYNSSRSTLVFLMASDVPLEGTIEIKPNALGIEGDKHPTTIKSNIELSIILTQNSSIQVVR